MVYDIGDSNRLEVVRGLMGVDRDAFAAPAGRAKLRDCADMGESKQTGLHVLREADFAGVLQEDPDTAHPGPVCVNMLSHSFARLSSIEELA
jgi:hypothetical protein